MDSLLIVKEKQVRRKKSTYSSKRVTERLSAARNVDNFKSMHEGNTLQTFFITVIHGILNVKVTV